MESEEQQAKKLAATDTFNAACAAFGKDQFEAALSLLDQVLKDNPQDGPAAFFHKWITEGPVEFVK